MKILALEFSSAQRSVAVGDSGAEPETIRPPEDQEPRSEIGHKSPGHEQSLEPCNLIRGPGWWEVVETGPGGVQPFAMIERALSGAGICRETIECIAIGIGPGSYTGIRAAIAMAQGWHLATAVRLLPVSSVDCLAAQAQAEGFAGRADFIIDAQRNELYLAGYEINATRRTAILPLRLAKPEEVASRRTERDMLFGPESRRWFSDARELFPRAETLGRLASQRTDFVAPQAIEPIYLRETTFVKAPRPRVYGLQ